MSFKATLQVEGQELNILHCRYEFSQNTDHKGKPSARPQGGRISLTVESTGDNFLVDWMTSETQVKSGSIIFYKRDSMAKMRELQFTDAYCVDFAEDFDWQSNYPLQIEFRLSAKELSFGGSSGHKNPWTK